MNNTDQNIFSERDPFYWYCRMDKASTLATLNAGIITNAQADEIARGINKLIQWGDENEQSRPTDYLDVQARLFKIAGSVASRMHSGRSRQDMLVTLHRLLLRDRFLLLFEKLLDIRSEFLSRARENRSVIVPTYTNGVQAQPALFGHLMSGYESPLARSTRRFMECYTRLNQSPLGSAALATSRFPLNRELLSELLGFNGIVENSFDAAQIAVVDTGIECAHIAALIALSLNMFTQDVHAQFHHVRPWIQLTDPDLLSASTLMPQKRNPVVLNRARLLGSEVVGASVTAAFAAHNVSSGLTDYKRMDASNTLELAIKLMSEISTILRGMRLDSQAALDELESEFTTTSELAALLQERADIPLSIAHGFASKMVDTARKERFSLKSIPFTIVNTIFSEVISEKSDLKTKEFPFSEQEFRIAVHPQTMVNNYRGKGGSSPGETEKLFEQGFRKLDSDRDWFRITKAAVNESEKQLDAKFNNLIKCS